MKLSNDDLKKGLTPIQYEVTRMDGTEPPFTNAFWKEKREGIYVDVVSGKPLFCSREKFECGSGWPSFTRPIEKNSIREVKRPTLTGSRTEVRSSEADSHLGYVFHDGPVEPGLRYTVNSAALRFIRKEYMEREGYGDLLTLFNKVVRDVMQHEIVFIDGNETVSKAIAAMRKKHVSCLIVSRRNHEDAWGIVTRKDIVTGIIDKGNNPDTLRVFEIMTKPVITVSPCFGLKYCARLLHHAGIRRAPVSDGRELVGIVSNADLFNAIKI